MVDDDRPAASEVAFPLSAEPDDCEVRISGQQVGTNSRHFVRLPALNDNVSFRLSRGEE